ncbi:MAG: ergothioneine biosynthesis protein EgtB, partial [Crocinitomicaceae bacterium]
MEKEYLEIRSQTIHFCSYLTIEDYIPQVSIFASPIKWHIAHTTWFFETFLLKQFLPNYKIFNSDFNFLFNSYYNTIGERVARQNRGLITRPGVSEVFEYRQYVDEHMFQLLKQNSTKEVLDLVVLGLNHEQQHLELMKTDLKFTLFQNPTNPVYKENGALIHQAQENQSWIKIPEGIYDIGFDDEGFSFDNELGKHKVFLQEFEIQKELVSNGEFMEFIEDGGYEKFHLWLDEGWSWVNENKAKAPLYWMKKENKWFHFTLGGLQEINPNELLTHVNFYEAAAFALWKGMRLPTEFEWEIASTQFNWGKRWEWTNSAYLAYPGFKTVTGAVGEYNGKFMINQMVLRGSSVATSENHSRKSYRNFFHPH